MTLASLSHLPASGHVQGLPREARRTGPVLHVVGSRSSVARLTPVFDALEALGLPQLLLGADASVGAVGVRGRPPATLAAVAREAGAGAGMAAVATGAERSVESFVPRMVLVVDDSDATVAVAVAAAKAGVPVVRLGAGLRCGDWGLREEVNRVVIDSVAALLLTDGHGASDALVAEGVPAERIACVGSMHADLVARWGRMAATRSQWTRVGFAPGEYVLVTLHRAENIEPDERLARVVAGITALARRHPVVLPLHPRTRARMTASGALDDLESAGVVVSGPLDYLSFLSLASRAGAVLTDSGGLQEETTLLGVPCFTLRRATERTLTLTDGTNLLLGDDPGAIATIRPALPAGRADEIPFWDGRAAERAAAEIAHRFPGD